MTKVLFVFFKKVCAASYVYAAQTTRRQWPLQTVCFPEDVSLKKVCPPSSWGRQGPTSFYLFSYSLFSLNFSALKQQTLGDSSLSQSIRKETTITTDTQLGTSIDPSVHPSPVHLLRFHIRNFN
ncbi:hypothetical protein Hanom_Chr09g00765781 [Helianthus anomalus]